MAFNSPIVNSVCRAMERIAPLRLAEKWDKVGLLLEAPVQRANANRVLLTIDLTTAVCDEALASPTAFIVAYHPPIFRPLPSLTLAVPLQRSLLRLAAAGISVFAPHTALDSVRGGINDWLARGLPANGSTVPARYIAPGGAGDPDSGGMGRVVTLDKGAPIEDVVAFLKKHLGLNYVQVATAGKSNIETVAICAGSGGSILLGVDADLYLTGEMSHHEILEAVATGHSVILCGHDNTERGYLHVLAEKLTHELDGSEQLEVVVSTADRHPLQMM